MGTAQYELHNVGYVEEDVYGTTPSSPTYSELWHNSSSVEGKRATFQSRRKLGNRQRPLPRLGKKMSEGNIDSELAFSAFDDWLEALMNGRFPVSAFAEVAGITIAAVASSQEFTDSGSGFTNIAIGDWVIVAGMVAANNNGVFRVTASASGAITVDNGTTLTDESAGASATVNQELRLEAGSDQINAFTEISASLEAVASGQHFLDAGSGMGNVAIGDWIVVAGQAAANNNGIFQVVTAAAGDITVEGGTTLTDEGPTASCTINQKTKRSFSLVGKYADQDIFHVFKGIMPKSGQFNIVPDDISKVSLGLLGSDFDAAGSDPGALTSPGSYAPFDALSGTFTEDGAAASCITNLSLTVENNNALGDKCLGTTVATEQFQGGFDVTGTIRFYFSSNAHVTKFWNETTLALVFTLSDPDGNSYKFALPYCKLTELDLKKGESDIEAEEGYNLTAGEDPDTGVTMYIVKTAA